MEKIFKTDLITRSTIEIKFFHTALSGPKSLVANYQTKVYLWEWILTLESIKSLKRNSNPLWTFPGSSHSQKPYLFCRM